MSGEFQGIAYATNQIAVDTTGKLQGPMISLSKVSLGQNGDISFPPMSIVPAGAPGDLPKAEIGIAGEFGG